MPERCQREDRDRVDEAEQPLPRCARWLLRVARKDRPNRSTSTARTRKPFAMGRVLFDSYHLRRFRRDVSREPGRNEPGCGVLCPRPYRPQHDHRLRPRERDCRAELLNRTQSEMRKASPGRLEKWAKKKARETAVKAKETGNSVPIRSRSPLPASRTDCFPVGARGFEPPTPRPPVYGAHRALRLVLPRKTRIAATAIAINRDQRQRPQPLHGGRSLDSPGAAGGAGSTAWPLSSPCPRSPPSSA